MDEKCFSQLITFLHSWTMFTHSV